MDTTALIIGIVLALVLFAGVMFFVGKQEGSADVGAEQEAKREGLKQGFETAEKQEQAAESAIREKLDADKKRDPVEVANELLKKG